MARFEAARQLYNACLGEALRRLDRMRSSRDWQAAQQIPREQKQARRAAFDGLQQRFGFSAHAIEAYGTACKNACWIGDHLDAHVTQKTALRAFNAVEQYRLGKRGRPRFKGRIKALQSVEGKSNAAGIRWRGDRVEWKGVVLRPLFDRKDKHGVQTFALQCRVKYVRLVWRQLRGRRRWYVQLVLEGRPKWKDKHPIGEGDVGLDIGPSTIAAVGEEEALLEPFCPSVEYLGRKIRRIQRAMDRSRRATNPDNYHPDGTVKKGPQRWVHSHGYLRLQAELRELQRRMAEARKTEHGRLANRLMAMGRVFKTEAVSIRAWQKRFGRSIRDRAPSLFLNRLNRKAESAGGRLETFPTRTTRLSQVCHHCGSVEKKPLSQRIHACGCGVVMQRDLYSAFLARCVEGEALHVGLARERWPGAEPLLRAAWRRATCDGKGKVPATFGAFRRQSGSSEEGGTAKVEASIPGRDGREAAVVPARTPCL
ncbi:transposase [Methylomarinovum tepidoasis]|uniref:Transposase n=1 Tax=Methylomarinovum tepidoasis TaxID=2840183 RepID=A0AAU9CA30_9GAMM|nr:transposase [Methylomarinovum sp. IN45]BCX88751.1 transposase [Methylomarinovum sp. IN45]